MSDTRPGTSTNDTRVGTTNITSSNTSAASSRIHNIFTNTIRFVSYFTEVVLNFLNFFLVHIWNGHSSGITGAIRGIARGDGTIVMDGGGSFGDTFGTDGILIKTPDFIIAYCISTIIWRKIRKRRSNAIN